MILTESLTEDLFELSKLFRGTKYTMHLKGEVICIYNDGKFFDNFHLNEDDLFSYMYKFSKLCTKK